MSRINLAKEDPASTIVVQSSLKNSFLSSFPKFPKDYNFLNQVLTIASICLQSNPIKGGFIGEFLAFIGIIYLPYVVKERDNGPMPPRALWMHTYYQNYNESNPRIPAPQHEMLNNHVGSIFDLEFKEFLDKNCQFLLELCRRPANSMPAPVPLIPRTNLELQLVLVDRALEAQSKACVSTEVEGKMEDKVRGEVLGKLSELAGSVKSAIEFVANGSNSLERPSKKRKEAPE